MTEKHGGHSGAAPAADACPLASVKPGKRVKLESMREAPGLARHLAGMGIRRGSVLLVVAGGDRGPVIVELDGCRYIIGRGMSRKILVSPLARFAPRS